MGRAIAEWVLASGIDVCLVDHNADSITTPIACDVPNAFNAVYRQVDADCAKPDDFRGNPPSNQAPPNRTADIAGRHSPNDCLSIDQGMLPEWCQRWIQHDPLARFRFCSPAATGDDAMKAFHAAPSIVLESIVERLPAKQSAITVLENVFDRDCLLASNTSTLPIHSIAAKMRHPDRLMGMHFFMPVSQRDAVEIIPHAGTTNTIVQRATAFVWQIKKSPLIVRDAAGFVVNRLLAPYLNAAMRLLCRGQTNAAIGSAARAFGMPLSPFQLVDIIGLRTAFDGGAVYFANYGGGKRPSPLLAGLLRRQRRSESRISLLDDGGNLSTSAIDCVLEYRDEDRAEIPVTQQQLTQLLFVPMYREALAILEAGVVNDREDINAALRGGLGFHGDFWARNWQNCVDKAE
ncbi:MAG: 3-hydroxyacyl-CoA dehydrogenase NAD-binding domain-containing protein [Planctomycetota bacterium]